MEGGEIEWTVSDSLSKLNIYDELIKYARFIKQEKSTITYQERITYPLAKKTCTINGITDLSSEVSVYEIKHCAQESKGMIQAAIYGMMTGKKSYLINTNTGQIYETSLDCKPSYFKKYARAIIALRIARKNRSRLMEPTQSIALFSHKKSVIVIDIEDYKIIDMGDEKLIKKYENTQIVNWSILEKKYIAATIKEYERRNPTVNLKEAWDEVIVDNFSWNEGIEFDELLAIMMIYISIT